MIPTQILPGSHVNAEVSMGVRERFWRTPIGTTGLLSTGGGGGGRGPCFLARHVDCTNHLLTSL